MSARGNRSAGIDCTTTIALAHRGDFDSVSFARITEALTSWEPYYWLLVETRSLLGPVITISPQIKFFQRERIGFISCFVCAVGGGTGASTRIYVVNRAKDTDSTLQSKSPR